MFFDMEETGMPRRNPSWQKDNMQTPQKKASLVDKRIEPRTFLLWGDSANHHKKDMEHNETISASLL